MGLWGVGRGGGRWLAGVVVVALLGGVWPLVGGAGAVPGRSVSGVSVSGGGDGVLVVSWEAPSEAPADYRVAWAREDLDFLSYSAADEPQRGNAYPAGDVTSLRLEGLTAGSTYKVLVRARYGSGGPGPWSSQATGDAGETEDATQDGTEDGSTGGTQDEAEDETENGSAGGGVSEGAGFAMEGVLEVGSTPYGDLTLLGFSTRGAGLGSFGIVSVGDPAHSRHVGGRGFVAGLMSAPGALSFGGFGPFDDAVVMMSPQMATPFVVEIGGRRYGSGEASLANGRGQSFRFWVWEDPCASWADKDRLDVTFSPGPYSGAELGGADTTLASLTVDGAVLDQGFDPTAADYSAAADPGVAQVTVDAAAADANACGIDITPADADAAAAGHQVDVDPDSGAVIAITVTAADQTTTGAYTVTVAPPAGTLPAAPAGMGLDGIDIDYQPDQKRYHATVPPTLRSTTVEVRTAPGTTARSTAYQPPGTATPPTTRGWAGALSRRLLTRSTADDAPSSQNADGTVDLASDRDTLVVTKVSTLDSEREAVYTARLRPRPAAARSQARSSGTEPRLSALTVSPGTLAPVFAAATFAYDVAVAHDVGRVTVAATAASGTTATVVAPDADSDAAGHQVALNPSSVGRSAQTAFIVLVTAGARIDSYTVTVTRAAVPSSDASLKALSVTPGTLMPAFDAGTTSYAAAVGSSASRVTVIAAKSDSGATVVVKPDDADAGAAGHQVAVGSQGAVITVTVTAPDGVTTRAYTVNATRASSDASLSALTLTPGTLSPAFDAGTAVYTAEVVSHHGMVTVAAVRGDAGAGVVISPPDADAGTAGHQVRVGPGAATQIAVAVTAADGATRRTYSVAVTATRPAAANGDVALSSLEVDPGALAPALGSGAVLYGAAYPSSTKTATITAAARHPDAQVVIGPADADPDTAGHQAALRSGDNPVTVRVISSNGAAQQSYVVTLTRAAPASPAAATLRALSADAGSAIAFDPDTEWYWVPDVGTAAQQATIAWAPTDPAATVTVSPADADPDTDGHQVTIGDPNTNVTVTVEAADGATARTYTIALYRDTRWVQIDAGWDHFCGLRSNGQAICWGAQVWGGWPKTVTSPPPQEAYRDIFAGQGHSCGTRTDGTFHCWTDEAWKSVRLNGRVDGGETGLLSMDTNSRQSYCWLDEHARQHCIGDPTIVPQEVRAGRHQMISSGYHLHCVVDAAGGLACWDSTGKLSTPLGHFRYVSAKVDTVCAIETSGPLTCWQYERPIYFAYTHYPYGDYDVIFHDDDHVYVDTGDNFESRLCGVTDEGDLRCILEQGALEGDYITLEHLYNGKACGITSGGTFDCLSSNILNISPAPLSSDSTAWPPEIEAYAHLQELSVAGQAVALTAADTTYAVQVPNTQAAADIAAQPEAASAEVSISPADSDPNTGGHQTALAVGDNTVTITVTSENGNTTRTYTITITRSS